MTEQNPDPGVTDDTEGHRYRADALDDVEGLDSMDDDTEGHGRRSTDDIGDEDDTEGHYRKPR